MRSTAFPRFSIDRSVSRSKRLASADVSRSSQRCTGSRNRLAQVLGEDLHLVRLNSFRATHPQRQANHDLPDIVFLNHPLQMFKVVSLVPALQSLQPLSCNPERIRHSDADASRANIKAQNSARWEFPGKRVFVFRNHAAIISPRANVPRLTTSLRNHQPAACLLSLSPSFSIASSATPMPSSAPAPCFRPLPRVALT